MRSIARRYPMKNSDARAVPAREIVKTKPPSKRRAVMS
jgi:hypothetical protein